MRAIAVSLLLGLSTASFGQSVELKGIRIGMPQEEFEAIVPPYSIKSPSQYLREPFTLGGVKEKLGRPTSVLKDGVLDIFEFSFEADEFDQLADAIREKYKNKLKCTKSLVQNRFGAKFAQEECHIGREMLMWKYFGDLNGGVLYLLSPNGYQEVFGKKSKKGDL